MVRKPNITEGVRALKATPVTIGILIALVLGVCAVIKWTATGQEVIRSTVKEVLHHHQERNIDRAHPDLPQRYTKIRVHEAAVQEIKGDIRVIRESQRRMETDISKLANGHRRRPR